MIISDSPHHWIRAARRRIGKLRFLDFLGAVDEMELAGIDGRAALKSKGKFSLKKIMCNHLNSLFTTSG